MQRDFLDQVFQKVPPNAFLAEKVMAGVDHPIFELQISGKKMMVGVDHLILVER